ncbi:hypothetical protein ACUN29_17745 [Streptomyces sp. WC2508]|uniref:hypothetical protein n=1 Tax=Streptomyces sp. WC2508 TaxID=3461405 RepID=UPI0040444D2B
MARTRLVAADADVSIGEGSEVRVARAFTLVGGLRWTTSTDRESLLWLRQSDDLSSSLRS